jgi:transcriptional regulator with XRE-family HTH domain
MIGHRIKERRMEQNLSLRDLGTKTGLTASFLSQIENDLTEPSITSLQKIATALKVVRDGSRRKLSFPNPHLTYELLTANLNRQMAGFIIQLKAGESHNAQQLYRATEEMMYVIQGELEIQVGENKHHLKSGDSIYYEGAQLTGFSSVGIEDLKVLCVITPPAL